MMRKKVILPFAASQMNFEGIEMRQGRQPLEASLTLKSKTMGLMNSVYRCREGQGLGERGGGGQKDTDF